MSNSAESNFRNAFKNFGARGGVAAAESSTTTSGGSFGRASDWFGGVRNQMSGYVPVALGGTPQPPPEEDWLGLTWFQVTPSTLFTLEHILDHLGLLLSTSVQQSEQPTVWGRGVNDGAIASIKALTRPCQLFFCLHSVWQVLRSVSLEE